MKLTPLKSALIAGTAFGLYFGLFEMLSLTNKYTLFIVPAAGLSFGVMMYFMARAGKINRQAALFNEDEGDVLYAGDANHFKNGEAVGGKLCLFEDRLTFKSHKLNIQNHELEIPVGAIREITFFKTLGLLPNGLAIHTKEGREEKFVVYGRSQWKMQIEQAAIISPLQGT